MLHQKENCPFGDDKNEEIKNQIAKICYFYFCWKFNLLSEINFEEIENARVSDFFKDQDSLLVLKFVHIMNGGKRKIFNGQIFEKSSKPFTLS